MDAPTIILAVIFPALLTFLLSTGIALTVADSTPNAYRGARICFVAAAYSITLAALYYATWASNLLVFVKLLIEFSSACFSIVSLLLCLRWVNSREEKASTKLFPGNWETPSLPARASPPPEALLLFMGSCLTWSTVMPHTVLTVGGDILLQFDRQKRDKSIHITLLRIFDDRHDIIARIDADGFWVHDAARTQRPDISTLIVFDHNDKEVLNIRYLNKKAILIKGIFNYKNRPPFEISDLLLKIGRMSFQNSSFGESGMDFVIR